MASLISDEPALSQVSELVLAFQLVNGAVIDPQERYQCLVESEDTYAFSDYASKPGTPFSTNWRRRIAEWLFQVRSHGPCPGSLWFLLASI